MTKKEFEEDYATKSGISIATLHDYGLFAAPCNCGEKCCNGWRMVTETTLVLNEDIRRATHIPAEVTNTLLRKIFNKP